MVMVSEEPSAVFQEIPDNHDIEDEDDIHRPRRFASGFDQFIDFDGDEEARLANGHPAGPAHAKDQPGAFYEREQAIYQGTGGDPQDVDFGDFADLRGEVGEKLSFGVQTQLLEQTVEFGGQVVVREGVGDYGKRQKQSPFEQLDRDDGIKGWRARIDRLGVAWHQTKWW